MIGGALGSKKNEFGANCLMTLFAPCRRHYTQRAEGTVIMLNSYQPSGPTVRRASNLLVAAIAFLSVLSVAVLCGLIAPAVAYFIARLPPDMNLAILRVSLSACIPFGLAAAFVAAKFATRETGVLSVLMLPQRILRHCSIGILATICWSHCRLHGSRIWLHHFCCGDDRCRTPPVHPCQRRMTGAPRAKR